MTSSAGDALHQCRRSVSPPLLAITKKDWEAVVANNLTGDFLVAREVFNPSMKKTGGTIVNMLVGMWRGMPGMGDSGAARAGRLNFTQTSHGRVGVCRGCA